MPNRLTTADFTAATENGRIFTVDFIKRTTGELRTMNCRRGVSKGVTGIGLPYDPWAKELMPVWDIQADGFRMVNLRDMVALRLAGKKYSWVDGAFVEVE